MAKWEIQVSMDERPQVLSLNAHSARAALAQLERHRASAAHNPGLQFTYDTPDGARVTIRWGRALNVTIGEVTVGGTAPGRLAPAG
jgi:hypothetical protein